MGLMLRYNLFYSNAESAYEAFASYYRQRDPGFRVVDDGSDRSLKFYREHNGWATVELDGGWEWDVRREAQLFVSRCLSCPGFHVFVYDGSYWGYEFFDAGEVIDHFVQYPHEGPVGFPGEDCRGNPRVIAEHLPFLRVEDIAPYLVPKEGDWDVDPDLNVPARPGDEFNRFDECAVLDFLRMLGVAIELEGRYVQLKTRPYRSLRCS